jgi:hypothetical protein
MLHCCLQVPGGKRTRRCRCGHPPSLPAEAETGKRVAAPRGQPEAGKRVALRGVPNVQLQL